MTQWFPFFGRDFITATSGWTAEERGHYVTLLIVQWEQGGLPDDVKRLELISPGLKGCWKTVAEKFPVWKDGKRRNTRLEHERAKSHERSERARQSASKSWAARRGDGDCQPDPNPPDPSDGICERICERISDSSAGADAPMSMLNSPPPPDRVSRDWRQDWPALLAAWNASKAGRQPWRSAEPPQAAGDRLSEPGWLVEAHAAIKAIEAGACRYFKTPVGLRQFCERHRDKGTFVSRVLGGEFADQKRETSTGRDESRRAGDDRKPADQAAAEWQRAAADPEAAKRRREYLEAKARKAASGSDDEQLEETRRQVLAKLASEG